MTSISLYDPLHASYLNKKEDANNYMKQYDYELDPYLSNINTRTYYNKNDNKVIQTYRGTSNISDVLTDYYVAFGGLDKTHRYKETKQFYDKAKDKYKDSDFSLYGHSLGASLGSSISNDKTDKIHSYNKGSGLFTTTKSNEKNYRTSGDLISLLSTNNKHKPINLKNSNSILNSLYKQVLNSHSIENLKNKNINI